MSFFAFSCLPKFFLKNPNLVSDELKKEWRSDHTEASLVKEESMAPLRGQSDSGSC